jgi:hypothetical protein
VLLVKLIEPPLADPHERWCERSEIPHSEEFPPTRLSPMHSLYLMRIYQLEKLAWPYCDMD